MVGDIKAPALYYHRRMGPSSRATSKWESTSSAASTSKRDKNGGSGDMRLSRRRSGDRVRSIVIRAAKLFKSDEDLIVKGRIDAEISSSKALFVENSGIIKANVRVKSVRISGVLVGNIAAEGQGHEIAPDGRESSAT